MTYDEMRRAPRRSPDIRHRARGRIPRAHPESKAAKGVPQMSFMEPDIEYMTAIRVQANCGETHVIPADLLGEEPEGGYLVSDLAQYVEGTPDADGETPGRAVYTIEAGWYYRLSAPGYMDCTDWSGPYASEGDAYADMCDRYDICPQCGEVACWDGPEPCPEDSDD